MKKILGVCCIAGIVSLANAFQTGVYECELGELTQLYGKITFELSPNNQAKKSLENFPQQSQYGYWEDRGNTALVLDRKTALIEKEGKYFVQYQGAQFKCVKKK